MKIERLKTNHIVNPLGFAIERPVFSYVVTDSTGKCQNAARIRVSLDADMECVVFDSGRDEHISSLAFAPDITMQPRTRYYWNVEVWADNEDHGISETAWFETGKMDEPWNGRWIRAHFDEHPLFFRDFCTDKDIQSARLYICGLGVYEAYLNGEKIGNEYLAPFFTSYNHHIQYQTYDVTKMLSSQNRLSVMLGRGWYHGRFGFGDPQDKIYGEHMQMIAELHITYTDGNHAVIATDESWLCTPGPVVESNIYDGELYDARRTHKEELTVVAVSAERPEGMLRERLSLPVCKQEELSNYELLHTPADEFVLDFGQVITGWVEFENVLPSGTTVKLEYGELLQNGCFYNENLRTAKAAHTYISNGLPEHIRPHFTYFGFRYVRIQGMTEEQIEKAKFIAYVIHSDLEHTGTIETSNSKVNRLIANAIWSQKDNFLDVPTDCPQRDERMGWTGDAQVFASTASYNMDTAAFYRKYLYDMLWEQKDNGGSVPHVVPDVLTARMRAVGQNPGEMTTAQGHGSCAWADAATVIPWTLYQYYGDKQMLEDTYENMRSWVDYIHRQDVVNCGGSHLWSCGFHFADWLALDNPVQGIPMGGTEHTYVATAYYYYSATLTAKAAKALGKTKDAIYYDKLAKEVKKAFQAEYFTGTGKLAVGTQTAHALALYMDLVPKAYRERIAHDLKGKLDSRGIHLDTGFVGTGILCDALSDNGLSDYAHTLLLNEDYPSWLYEVNMGATTIWERWNSVLPDGSVSDTGMNSMNHYAYGAVVGWMYRCMAGLNPAEDAPGWKKAVIRPITDKRFDWVQARYDSASGLYESTWHRESNIIKYNIQVPFGAEAEFHLAVGQKMQSVNGVAVTDSVIMLAPGNYEIVAQE